MLAYSPRKKRASFEREEAPEIVYAKRLKENRSPATANTLASERGKKTFQPKRISWSYRYRGKAARTQIKNN